MPNKVDYRTFSQRVKNKYPEYINMGDLELAQMWVEQNPQYGEFVMFDEQPVKKKTKPHLHLANKMVYNTHRLVIQ